MTCATFRVRRWRRGTEWPQDVRRRFKTLCGRAGVGNGWTPREQRHTFVSVLSDSGVDIEQIADVVGHVNSTVTKAVYRYQIADEITSAASVMDSIFGEASSSQSHRLPPVGSLSPPEVL